MNTFRQKIILTAHTFSQGGTDRVCALLARGFAAAGYETELVVFAAGGAAESTLVPLLGNEVALTFLGKQRASRLLELCCFLPHFVALLRRVRPDYVLSTANGMNWITTLAYQIAGLYRSRLILKISNPIIRAHDSGAIRALRNVGYRCMYRCAAAVLTLSNQDTDLMRHHFPRLAGRFRTVCNPSITPELLAISPFAAPGAEKTILAIGRLEPQKRFDLAIKAFAEIKTPARLIILGDGSCRGSLLDLVQQLGIGDRVDMPGFVPDVYPWLQRADIMALTSVYEGVPAVVLQAMALNCPVVATNCFPAAAALVGTAEGCALAEAAPTPFAQAIDACLAKPRPTTLSIRTEPYHLDNAVKSYLDAMQLQVRDSPILFSS
jgi:glycosyltransferase involved in cell wall biosynthesis